MQIVPTYSLTAHATMNSPLMKGAQSGLPNSSPDFVPPPLTQPTRDLMYRRDSIRAIWEKNCAGLDAQQQMSLWQLLWEFNDIFTFSDDEVQSLVISHGHGPQKEEHEMEVLCGLQPAEQGDKEGLLPHSVSR